MDGSVRDRDTRFTRTIIKKPRAYTHMPNESQACKPLLRIIGLPIIVVVGLAADNDSPGCLQADVRGAEHVVSAPQPISELITERASLLGDVLGITQRVPVSHVPSAGIGRTIAPCKSPSGSSSDPPRIETDSAELMSANTLFPATVDVVLAHELSHILQFRASAEFSSRVCAGNLKDVRIYELMADFGAGFALYKVGRKSAQLDFANAVSALADYRFKSPLHHGTVSERISAFNMGQASALFGRPMKMDALLRNQDAFLRLVGGAPESQLQAHPTDYADFARHALDEIYK